MDNIQGIIASVASIVICLLTFGFSIWHNRRRDKKEIKFLTEDLEAQRKRADALGKMLEETRASIPTIVKEQRQQAVTTSRAVLKGKISEEIVPLLPNFPYQVSDMKFFGAPIDFIIFDGMSNGVINNIIFMDVKTGGSRLTPIQKKIREAIQAGRVSWHTYVRE